MYNRAMDKIRDEMAKHPSNPGIQFLGGWLTGQLEQKPETAQKILAEGKSIEGAFGEIRKYAEKHKTGNFAFVPPEKALEIVSGYYGLEINQPEEPQAPAQRRPEADDLDLDTLLGGL